MLDQSSRLTFSVLRDEKSFTNLELDWQSLFLRAAVRTPFLRYSWARLCWARQRTDRSAQLFIIIVRENGRVVLIAPFLAHRIWPFFQTLSFLDSQTPQYNDVLVEGSEQTGEYVAYLCATLRSMSRVRRLRLLWIREDSPLSPYLASFPQRLKRIEWAPFIDLTKFGNWEAYVCSLSQKLRADHRRQMRHLQKLGGVTLRFANDCTLSDNIRWLFAAKRNWVERTQPSPWLTAPETEKLFTSAAVEGLVLGRTWHLTLFLDVRPIAALLAFREEGTLYASKIAYDPDWQRYSPARTLMLLTIERAFKEGLEKCDLMIGEGDWKRRIATGSIKVTNRRVKLPYISRLVYPPRTRPDLRGLDRLRD